MRSTLRRLIPISRPMLILIGLLVAVASTAFAQGIDRERLAIADSTIIQVIELRDGSRLVGRITSIGDSTLVFRAADNVLTLRIADIVSVERMPASTARTGGPWLPHPHQTNLVVGPTGRTLARGQGFFTLHELFFPTLNFGITDYLTFGGGATLLPGLSLEDQIVYVLPKVAIVRSRLTNVAIGAVLFRAGDIFDISEDGAATFGILYGSGTVGSPDANVTAGLGYGFTGDEIDSQPLLQLGGQLRVGSGVALITEHWLIGRRDDDLFWLQWSGLRFIHRKAAVDAAVMFAPENGAWLPWVGVTLGF